MDFGGAVVRNGPTLATTGAGQCCPSYFDLVTHFDGKVSALQMLLIDNESDPEQALRGGGIVMGKDNNDNWWIDWYIRKELWPALEQKIDALAV